MDKKPRSEIIAEWLHDHGKSWSEYDMRLARDGEVFLGPDGFIEPENASGVTGEKMTVREFVSAHRISDDPIVYKFNSRDIAGKFVKSEIEPPGVVGHRAGKMLSEAMRTSNKTIIELGDDFEKTVKAHDLTSEQIYKLNSVAINMSFPHNPGKIKRFFRWILAKIRGDIPVRYLDSSGNIYKGWAKRGEIKRVEKDINIDQNQKIKLPDAEYE